MSGKQKTQVKPASEPVKKKKDYGEPLKGAFPMTPEGHRDFDKERSCCSGDCLCCFLFLAGIIALIVIGAYAFAKGDPRKLYYPIDYNNSMCGAEVVNRTFLYMPLLLTMNMSNGWCMSECPTNATGNCICRDDQAVHMCGTRGIAELTGDEPNCYFAYDSTDVYLSFGRCIPAQLSAANASMVMGDYTNLAVRGIRDVWATWWVFLVGAAACLVLCIMWMLVLRFCAGCMVWTGVFLVITVVAGIAAYLLYYGIGQYQEAVAAGFATKSSIVVIVIGGVMAGADVLLLLIIFALCSRIRLAIAIVKVATMAVANMKSMFFAPILTVVLMGGVTAWVVATFCWLFSMGNILTLTDGSRSFNFDWTARYLSIYVIFMFFWLFFWLYGMTQTILSGAIHMWYFTKRDKSDNLVNPQSLPLTKSFVRMLKYHTGGVAFGSLLIAIIATIRVIVLYFQQQMKKSQNKVVQYVLGCVQCCLACCQKLIEYMSKNAYIQMALTGKCFCISAKNAFQLIMRNILRVTAVTGVGEFMIFAGKLVVSLLCGLIATLIIRPSFVGVSKTLTDVTYWWLPVILITVMAFFMSSAIFTVYGFTMDTLFFDFIEDEERARNSSGEYVPYAPSALRECMDNVADAMRAEREAKRRRLEEEEAEAAALPYTSQVSRFAPEGQSAMTPQPTVAPPPAGK